MLDVKYIAIICIVSAFMWEQELGRTYISRIVNPQTTAYSVLDERVGTWRALEPELYSQINRNVAQAYRQQK
ncbi:hypothetical protein V1515DRAFT_606247 [Lipomyces mesembrius]